MNSNCEKIGIKWDSISKIFILIYIVYGRALVPLGYQYGRLSSLILITALVACCFADSFKITRHRCIEWEFIFVFVTAISSLIVARDFSISADIIGRLFESAVVGYIIVRIADRNNNINCMVFAWLIVAVILAVNVIVTGGYTQAGGRISISETMNVNTLGVIMMLGVWCALYLFLQYEFSWTRTSITIGLVLICLYVSLMTASRKSIVSCIIIIFLWLILCLRPYIKTIPLQVKIISIVFILFAILFIFKEFGEKFLLSSALLQQRMQKDSFARGGSLRFDLIKDAFYCFLKEPILGVGWNNYKLVSSYSMYSHCTYVEILACTGFVGSFVASIWSGIFVKSLFRARKKDFSYYAVVVLLIVLLIDFAMQIVFYNENLLYMVNIIFAYTHISNKASVVHGGDIK